MDYIYTYKKQVNKMCIDLDKKNKRKIALMCLERQYKTYEHLANNKEWDKRVEYRELLDECWKVILEDGVLEEDDEGTSITMVKKIGYILWTMRWRRKLMSIQD